MQFTDEEIEWARRELDRRVNEKNQLARQGVDPGLERAILIARSRRSREAGLSRSRHHALLANVKKFA